MEVINQLSQKGFVALCIAKSIKGLGFVLATIKLAQNNHFAK
jgi:hypothetical protein